LEDKSTTDGIRISSQQSKIITKYNTPTYFCPSLTALSHADIVLTKTQFFSRQHFEH